MRSRRLRFAASWQSRSQRAIRNLALEVFDHLHALSLRFHLERDLKSWSFLEMLNRTP